MGNNESFIINGIVDVCGRLDRKKFGANHDGNVTVKYGDRIFATPTGVSKADISADMVLALDLSGNKIAGHGKPFSEMNLHLAAYRARPDISAVVHAHPPYATARGLVGSPLDRPSIPESIVSIGDVVPVGRPSMPGDPENESIILEMLQMSNVFMLAGNGVIAVGTDVIQAYLRLELVEHLAKIDFIAGRLGTPQAISVENVNKLLDKRTKAGLAPPVDARGTRDEGRGMKDEGRGTKDEGRRMKDEGRGTKDEGRGTINSDIRRIIEEEVSEALNGFK